MTALWLAGLAGLAMGLRHAMDPDHVVAVSTILARTRRRGSAWVIGAAWGVGHTATFLACGVAIVGLGLTIPARLSTGFEALVGLMLVALGAWAWRGGPAPGMVRHEHEHEHEPGEHGHHVGAVSRHVHLHVHLPALSRELEAIGPRRLLRSSAVGLVHGLAGSSAVGLALSAAMPARCAILYLFVSGIGTLLGMAGLSAVLSWSMLRASSAARMGEWLTRAVATASIALGVVMIGRWFA